MCWYSVIRHAAIFNTQYCVCSHFKIPRVEERGFIRNCACNSLFCLTSNFPRTVTWFRTKITTPFGEEEVLNSECPARYQVSQTLAQREVIVSCWTEGGAPRISKHSASTTSNLSIWTSRASRSGMLYPAVLTRSKSCMPSVIPPISSRFNPKLSARWRHVLTSAFSAL